MDQSLEHGRSRRRLLGAGLLACAVAVMCAPAAVAKPRALPAARFAPAPGSLTRGRAVKLGLRLAGGDQGTGRAVLILAISADKRLDKHDTVLATTAVGALQRGRSRSISPRVRATSRTPLGRRKLLACVAPSR